MSMSQKPMLEPRNASSRRAVARRTSSSSRLRSEMSWMTPMA